MSAPAETPGRFETRLASLPAPGLVASIAAALFVLSAWPLLLVTVPPLQDLPNHLAAAHIVANPGRFPAFVFNGLFKSNSLLPLWLYLTAGEGGPRLYGAARAFTAMVLGLNAVALPVFVLRFAGRRALLVATLFFWPLVHGFFLSMGMLNFTAAFALSLILLVLVDRQRERPTAGRAAGVAVVAAAVWYAHAFPLAVVAGLVGLHVLTRASWRQRVTAAVALFAPLAPAAVLAAVAAQHHLVKVQGATSWAWSFSYLNPLEIVAHLWTDVSGAFTRLGATTLAPALLLPVFVWRRRRASQATQVDEVARVISFLTWPALALLAAIYVALPTMLSNWGYFHCRLVPFLWAGLLVRVPARVPRPAAVGLVFCALAFSAATGVDYLRLDRDRTAFTAAMPEVPRGATLLPLMFQQRKTSSYTASLSHAWGFYTVEKDTSAPLVFAVERSYPITYREFPPRALIPPSLDRFAELYGTPAAACKRLRPAALDDAVCHAVWRDLWAAFWAEAAPRFTHIVTWAMPPESRAAIPPVYHRVFSQGDLELLARE